MRAVRGECETVVKMPRWPEVSIVETFLRLSNEIKLKEENSATLFHDNTHSYISRMVATIFMTRYIHRGIIVYFRMWGF